MEKPVTGKSFGACIYQEEMWVLKKHKIIINYTLAGRNYVD